MHYENGQMDVDNLSIRREPDVVFFQGPGEKPLEPRHLPPQESHGVLLDLVLDVVERVLNLKLSKKPNLPQIFVQLGPVIDVLSLLEKKSKNVEKIIEKQA